MALLQIAKDLQSFLLVLGIILLLFTNLLFVVTHPRTDASFGDDDAEEPFSNVGEALLTSYQMFLGNFEREWFSAAPDTVSRQFAVIFFVAFLLVLNVLLLNVLIAIVSDSYSYSKTRSLRLFYRARLELAAELQALLGIRSLKDSDEKSSEMFLLGCILRGVLPLIVVEPKRVDFLQQEAKYYFADLDRYTSRRTHFEMWFPVLCFPVLLPVLAFDGLTWLLRRYAFVDSGSHQTGSSEESMSLLALKTTIEQENVALKERITFLEGEVGSRRGELGSVKGQFVPIEKIVRLAVQKELVIFKDELLKVMNQDKENDEDENPT
eukprot:scaffold739_cov166-Pinguiococcus_pyrenoidosus.AAC.1